LLYLLPGLLIKGWAFVDLHDLCNEFGMPSLFVELKDSKLAFRLGDMHKCTCTYSYSKYTGDQHALPHGRRGGAALQQVQLASPQVQADSQPPCSFGPK
jgi:hypothetical protein